MSDLRKAAQSVIQAWDDPAGTTGVCRALDDLRAALATVSSDCPVEPVFGQRKPLTVAETNALIDSVDGLGIGRHVMHKVARAIERAHGIGGKDE